MRPRRRDGLGHAFGYGIGERALRFARQKITMKSRRRLKLVGVCIFLAGSIMADAAYAADVYNGGQIAQRIAFQLCARVGLIDRRMDL
jgi:hypothetical protein